MMQRQLLLLLLEVDNTRGRDAPGSWLWMGLRFGIPSTEY